jgi:hypothetical protein
VPDHAKHRGVSQHVNRTVKVQLSLSDISTFTVTCTRKDKVYDIISDRVGEIVDYLAAEAAGRKGKMHEEWEHIVPWLRTDPAFYYDSDKSPIYDCVNRFKKELVSKSDESKVRLVLDYIMSTVEDAGTKLRLIKLICTGVRLDIPDTVKTVLAKEISAAKSKANKKEVKTEPSSSSGGPVPEFDLTTEPSEEEEEEADEGYVIPEYSGRKNK